MPAPAAKFAACPVQPHIFKAWRGLEPQGQRLHLIAKRIAGASRRQIVVGIGDRHERGHAILAQTLAIGTKIAGKMIKPGIGLAIKQR